MFLSPEKYETGFYFPLRRAALTGGCTVLILPTTSVDALCATRMLTSMLESDYIQHKVIPIGGWEDLKRAADEEIAGSSEIRSVVVIGCGSHVNLMEYWAEALESLLGNSSSQVNIFVIDPHRPYNLANLFSRGSKVTVLDDGDAELLLDVDEVSSKEMQPNKLKGLKEAFLDIEFDEEDSDDTDSDDDEIEEDEEDEISHQATAEDSLEDHDTLEPPRQRRRLDGFSSDAAPRVSRRALRSRKRMNRERVSKYYASGTWNGMSASSTVFAVASVMQRVDNELLWLAILGLTSQFFRDEIPYTKYSTYASLFEDEVARLNIGLNDTDLAVGLGHGQDARASSRLGHSRKANDNSIRVSTELRFLLHKHWSLTDSMLHTPYIASKFSLWSDPGRRRLNRLLAKMGFSAKQCSVPYQFMDMDLKRSLRKKLENIGAEYDLDDVVWKTFERAYGFRGVLSAGDVVCGIEAILECAPEISLRLRRDSTNSMQIVKNGAEKENRRPDSQTDGTKERESGEEDGETFDQMTEKYQGRRDWWIGNWFHAYDSLQSFAALKSSLSLSMSLHRRLVSKGISVMEKRSIKKLRTFRLLVMRDMSTSTVSSMVSSRSVSQHESSLWTNPSMLNKLAMWLFQATKVEAKQLLPLVVAVFDETQQCWCVVGVNGSEITNLNHKNHFSTAFNECADRTGAQVRIDSFDTNLIEIAKDDLEPFVEGLVIKM